MCDFTFTASDAMHVDVATSTPIKCTMSFPYKSKWARLLAPFLDITVEGFSYFDSNCSRFAHPAWATSLDVA